MARATKSLTANTNSSNTSLTLIDQELANEAELLKQQLNAPSGNKIKVEVAGSFTLPDGLDLGSEIQVVVLDTMSRNFFYSGPYNPNNIVPPDCYAIGKSKDMVPEQDAPNIQSDACKTCPQNVFGSGANGTSKACQNRYWLAVLIVDPDNPDAHNEPDAPTYLLDLSPSNLKSFEGQANSIMRMMNGPPVKAILTVRATNAGTYAKITFHDPVPNPNYAAHFARRAEVIDVLSRRPDFAAAAANAAAKPSRQPARRQLAGARR